MPAAYSRVQVDGGACRDVRAQTQRSFCIQRDGRSGGPVGSHPAASGTSFAAGAFLPPQPWPLAVPDGCALPAGSAPLPPRPWHPLVSVVADCSLRGPPCSPAFQCPMAVSGASLSPFFASTLGEACCLGPRPMCAPGTGLHPHPDCEPGAGASLRHPIFWALALVHCRPAPPFL